MIPLVNSYEGYVHVTKPKDWYHNIFYVGQLRHYSQDFHRSIDYLTGTTEQVAAVARSYRVYFRLVDLVYELCAI